MTLGVKQVEEILENHPFTSRYGDRTYTDNGWSLWSEVGGTAVEVDGLGSVTVVESVGGYEDGGSTRYLTFKVTDEGGSRYFRKNGYYSSYDGTEWDYEFTECVSETKTVTVYEPI